MADSESICSVTLERRNSMRDMLGGLEDKINELTGSIALLQELLQKNSDQTMILFKQLNEPKAVKKAVTSTVAVSKPTVKAKVTV